MTTTLTLERMRADIARILGEDLSAVGDDDNLIDLGLDSVRAMSLVQTWREAGVRLEFSDLIERLTLADWWKLVAERGTGRSA